MNQINQMCGNCHNKLVKNLFNKKYKCRHCNLSFSDKIPSCPECNCTSRDSDLCSACKSSWHYCISGFGRAGFANKCSLCAGYLVFDN